MIKININNKKTIHWNYKRFISNVAPILFLAVWFVAYLLVSTMEYNGIINK